MPNHLIRAHTLWKALLSPGERAIDATCGNGHDTLFLHSLGAEVIAYDVQEAAIEATRQKVPSATFHLHSHAHFIEKAAALIVYNLGYLPGGDKSLTTRSETTLQSVQHALTIAEKALCITCYPGHPERAREEAMLLSFCQQLNPQNWAVSYHQWLNKEKAPSLIWLLRLPS